MSGIDGISKQPLSFGGGFRPGSAVVLSLALLVYSSISVTAVFGALLLAGFIDHRVFGVAHFARFGIVPILVLIACCAVIGLGARRVSARFAVPHTRVLAGAAVAFFVATALDGVIVALAGGVDETVNSTPHTLVLEAVPVGVWLLTAGVWGVGVTSAERRRADGLPTLTAVVVTGVTMGALHVAAWLYLASPLTPDANPAVF